MKIGFSFGRCIRDIVNGTVDFDDVLLIVARTNMVNEEGLIRVIESYSNQPGYLLGLDITKCFDVGLLLWRNAKIYEPRSNGGQFVFQVSEGAVWMDLFPTAPTVNETVKNAWEQYRMLISMVEQLPEINPAELIR